MLSFLITLCVLAIGFPKKSTREQDRRSLIAYVTLMGVGLMLAVLHVTGTSYVLTDMMQNVMNSIVEKVGG